MKKYIKKITPKFLITIYAEFIALINESFLSKYKIINGKLYRFNGQCGEDAMLFKKYLNYRNGFFIELGAMDGVIYSNSKFFEDNLDWKGILIEPTKQYDDLVKNRPNAFNFNYAISNVEGEVEFVGDDNVAGLKHTMSESHSKRWNLETQNSYFAKSIPISTLLSWVAESLPEKKIKKIDLFSIDVEGGELEVLQTYNWDIPCYIILIELDGQNRHKDQLCRDLLLQKGYKFELKFGVSEVWKIDN